MIPYARQTIDAADIQRVVEALQSPWLTTGPLVDQFESAVAAKVKSEHAVAFSSGTAALHGAAAAIGVQPGDEVIVPAITFVATANAVVYCGARPVFADVCPDTLLIDPQDVLRKISARTKAIFAVDYAGQPCDYGRLKQIAAGNRLTLVADASHSLGSSFFGRQVPQWVDLACYSFHPVKPITTCEGGMVVTNAQSLVPRLRQFRNHGIDADHHRRQALGTCQYDMQQLGFNYRLSDVQSALGLSQLKKLDDWTAQRNRIADRYRRQLANLPHVTPLCTLPGVQSSYHLFVIKWNRDQTGIARDDAIEMLRQCGIRANIHYRPVYQHSFYRQTLTGQNISCPVADDVYEQIISLPMFPGMTGDQVRQVVGALDAAARRGQRHHRDKAA